MLQSTGSQRVRHDWVTEVQRQQQQSQVQCTQWVLNGTTIVAAITVVKIQTVESHADTHDSLTVHLNSHSLERGPSSCSTSSVKGDS